MDPFEHIHDIDDPVAVQFVGVAGCALWLISCFWMRRVRQLRREAELSAADSTQVDRSPLKSD